MGNNTDYPVFALSDTKEVQTEHSYLNTEEEEYFRTYDELKYNQHFFSQFLHECPNFGNNLKHLFPNALNTPQQYFQMVNYLKKYDAVFVSNTQAQQNCLQSTLLDRFFMLCLGNLSYQKYKETKVSRIQIQILLLDYYKLFVPEPKIHLAIKLIQFIDGEEFSNPEEMVSVKCFAEKLRELFPHVQRYLKDYYYAKFHNGEEYFRLLKHFKSQILNQDAALLALRLPQLEKPEITELYNSDEAGTGFYMLHKHVVGYTGPWLLLVKHREKNFQGHWQNYVFGSYQNGPIKDISGFQGDMTGFMFSLEPIVKFMPATNGDGSQNYFIISSGNQLITKQRKGLGFGGNEELENFKLWIDENMDKSTVYNGYDKTYGYGPLAGQSTEQLEIVRVEIWGLGSEQNLRDQLEYRKLRNSEILKMRKVKRNEFLNEPQIFLENVYSYKDQVGEVENAQKKQASTQLSRPSGSHVTFKGKQNENPLL